jgi:hypothetical protein
MERTVRKITTLLAAATIVGIALSTVPAEARDWQNRMQATAGITTPGTTNGNGRSRNITGTGTMIDVPIPGTGTTGRCITGHREASSGSTSAEISSPARATQRKAPPDATRAGSIYGSAFGMLQRFWFP